MRTAYFVLFLFLFLNVTGQDHSVEVLHNDLYVSFDGTKLSSTYSYSLFIKDGRGIEYEDIEVDYTSLERIFGLKADIIDTNGQVKKLKKKDIITRNDMSSGTFYQDSYVKEFSLRHNRYPHILNYSYTIVTNQYVHLARWFPVMDPDIPTKKSKFELRVPLNTQLEFVTNGVDDPKMSTEDDFQVYKWEAEYGAELNSENYAPPWVDLVPSVYVTPEKFYYDAEGSLSTWKDFGNYFCGLFEGLNDLPPSEKSKVRAIASGADTDKEKIRLLYHYLQDKTRYVNISLGTGGFIPFPASHVAEKGFGDCKALSNYFKSVLEVIDIESHYSLVQSGSKIESFDMEQPYQHFDHAILCVPLEGDTLWIDCTSSAPFEYVSSFIQGRPALLIKKDASEFGYIPSLQIDDVLDERRIDVRRTSTGKGEAHFVQIVEGPEFESLHSVVATINENSKDRILRRYFLADEFSPLELEVIEYGRDTVKVGLDVELESNTLYQSYGNEIMVKLIPFELPNLDKPKYRSTQVKLNYPINKKDVITYKNPAAKVVSGLPKAVSIENEFGSYSLEAIEEDGKVIVEKEFVLYSGLLAESDYQAFYDFITRINSIENSSFIIYN